MEKLVHSRIGAREMILTFSLCVLAQAGDREGDSPQIENWTEWEVPPAKVLSPSEELDSFEIADGFVVDLIASEPLIVDPVAAAFDEKGRMWVVEMRGFMPNVDGAGEEEPVGKVVVLEDLDGDGVMDRSTPFLEGLILPRAITIVKGGVLVLSPPQLLFCQDLDGDLRCDKKTIVTDNWTGITSPEHAPNGMIHGLDNRIHFAKHNAEASWLRGEWKTWPASAQGQWGVTMDNWGRLFFNTNSSILHTDFVPRSYGKRNMGFNGLWGLGRSIMRDQRVWPSRITPGVNRGYRPETLRSDGTLLTATGVCGPGVIRGSAFLESERGSLLIPEPCANLVKRVYLDQEGGDIRARNAQEDGKEFWTSTDERFRPVNVIDGPDGATYVLDFYRGLIQHRLFVTTYLRKQVLGRGLDEPIGLGRIWRIRQKDVKAQSMEVPEEIEDWVPLLGHADGFWRDSTQRMLVESGDSALGPMLEVAVHKKDPLLSLHAIWTLKGLGLLKEKTVAWALENAGPKELPSIIQASESLLPGKDGSLLRLIYRRAVSGDLFAKRQVVLSLLSCPDDMAQRFALDLFFDNRQDPIIATSLATVPQDLSVELLKKIRADRRFDSEDKIILGAQVSLVGSSKLAVSSDSESPVYARTCLACHGADGLGQPGLAPPLNDSVWLGKSKEELISIVLNGLEETIQVNGETWNQSMPAWRALLNDADIAEVLNDVQRRFNPNPQIFTKEKVESVRKGE